MLGMIENMNVRKMSQNYDILSDIQVFFPNFLTPYPHFAELQSSGDEKQSERGRRPDGSQSAKG
jgi:hypothetical protein